MHLFEQIRDKTFLSRINSGDTEAFTKIYDCYAPKIYKHVYFRVNEKEVTEDITSKVFLKAWEYIKTKIENRQTEPIINIKAFLYEIARNLVIDYYRARGRAPDSLEEKEELSGFVPANFKPKIETAAQLALVRRCLESLPEEAKELVIYRYFDGLMVKDIARLVGKNENAVSVALHRALKDLKDKLN